MKTAIIAGLCFLMVFFNHGAPTSSDAGTACIMPAAMKQAAAVTPAANRLKAVELKEEAETAEVVPVSLAATEPAAGGAPQEDRSSLRALKPVYSMMGEDADSYASGKQDHLMQALMR
jgi:hypothetical protein